MSNESTFTTIGTEATKIIFKVLEKKVAKTHETQIYTKDEQGIERNNSQIMDWNKARQLSLFDYAVGS